MFQSCCYQTRLLNFESFVFIVFDGGRWRQDLGRSLDRKRWLLIYLWSIRRSMREISSRAGTLGCQSSTVHQASATSNNFRLCITDECWRSDKSQWCHCVGCNTWCKSSENRHEKTLGARGNLVSKAVGVGEASYRSFPLDGFFTLFLWTQLSSLVFSYFTATTRKLLQWRKQFGGLVEVNFCLFRLCEQNYTMKHFAILENITYFHFST